MVELIICLGVSYIFYHIVDTQYKNKIRKADEAREAKIIKLMEWH